MVCKMCAFIDVRGYFGDNLSQCYAPLLFVALNHGFMQKRKAKNAPSRKSESGGRRGCFRN